MAAAVLRMPVLERPDRAGPPGVPPPASSGGQMLPATTRAFFEPRMGRDLGHVHVHHDARAADAARAVDAQAYTVGRDIVFAAGRYAPDTPAGMRLLAHELAHVSLHSDRAATPAAAPPVLRLPLDTPAPVPGAVADEPAEPGTEDDAPDYGARSVIWFPLNSDRPREDDQARSSEHLALALSRIAAHAAVVGDPQTIVLHGYASRDGTPARNLELSGLRAERVRQLLVAAGVPPARIASVAHGADETHRPSRWNRRVEIELRPTVDEVVFGSGEGSSIVGTPPRSGPMTIEPTGNLVTPTHGALRDEPRIATDPISPWSESDVVKMQVERAIGGKSSTLLQYKDAWVRAHRAVIREVARRHDLPDWFVAGVAWAEVGGDPPSIDHLAYSYRRDIGIGSRSEADTSFGAVSIQIRRAAEELGYDPLAMSKLQRSFLIGSLGDPQQNLFIVGSHLDRLRDVDFPGKPAELLTDDDLRVTGTRYNRGPDLPLERIRQNMSHGESIVAKRERLQRLLAD